MKGNPLIWNLTLIPWSIKKRDLNTLNMKSLVRKTRILDILWILSRRKKILKESFEIPQRKIVESFKDNSIGLTMFHSIAHLRWFWTWWKTEKLAEKNIHDYLLLLFLSPSFFLSFEIKLFKRCYLRTRHKKKPIEDAFYAEQRSKREHKNQSSSRGQAKGSIVAILASKLLSLSSPVFIFNFIFLVVFPPPPLICLLYLTGRWSAWKGKKKKKNIYLFISRKVSRLSWLRDKDRRPWKKRE